MKTIPTKWKSLRVRLVATALIIEVIMLCLLVWNSQRIATNAIIEQTEYRLNELKPILNASLAGLILQEDMASLKEIVTRIVKGHGLRYLQIVDATGNVLARKGTPSLASTWSLGLSFSEHINRNGLMQPYSHQLPVTIAGQRIGTIRLEVDTRAMQQSLSQLRSQGMIIAIIAICLTGLFLAITGVAMTRQLAFLTEATNRIKDGDLSVRVPILAQDELGSAASAFNAMADQILIDQEALRLKSDRIRLLMDSTTEGICGVDRQGRCIFANRACIKLLGYRDESELAGTHILTAVRHRLPEQDAELANYVQDGEYNHSDQAELRLSDQREIPVEYWSRPIYQDEELLGAVLTFIDITERKNTERALRDSEAKLRSSQERFNLAVQGSSDGIWDHNLVTDELFVSDRFMELLGYTDADRYSTRQAVDELIHPDDRDIAYKALQEHLIEHSLYHLEVRMRRGTGDHHWFLIRGQAIWDADGMAIRMAGSLSDIGIRKESEVQIERLAFYDELTGLPNRRYFLDRLARELASVEQHGKSGALLFLDLDHFKRINDSLGHHVGDSVLQEVAQRMADNLYTDDTVARLGGDEFVVLLPQLHDDPDMASKRAQRVAERLRLKLNEPCTLRGHSYHISPSIGVVMYPQSGVAADELLKYADTALYRSKESGRNQVSFYQPEMKQAADDRLRLEKDLHNALDNNQLSLVFQPQVDLSGTILGAEALLRWHHPGQGHISPADFIPVAEETGLIIPIGEWVMQHAMHCLAGWLRDSLVPENFVLAINISPHQFQQAGFVEQVTRSLMPVGKSACRVKLEITEGTAMRNVHDTIEKIMALKPLGIGFSIDDFGKGYSSLSYIKQLPIDQLKIDRSFVRDICDDPDDLVIVKTIISMAKHLHLNVIAEGVETREQVELLLQHGCQSFQGFYFSRPLPVEEFDKRLLDQVSAPGSRVAAS